MNKEVSISFYLVYGGIGLFFIGLIFMRLYSQWFSNPERAYFELFFDHVWIFIVSILVVITGTIWGFVDWMRTRTHKRKSQADTAYADQTEEPPTRGIIAFWVGFGFCVACAIVFPLLLIAKGGI